MCRNFSILVNVELLEEGAPDLEEDCTQLISHLYCQTYHEWWLGERLVSERFLVYSNENTSLGRNTQPGTNLFTAVPANIPE